ncbi:hypothetical protein [Agrococcus sp. DT81.2]|uniref:hypothetical protein n=1 Tax=Agrococcus sp. DT81.2 TaxID=3393414 RepID=UPI003CE59E14
MTPLFPPLEPGRRTGDLLSGGALLLVTAVLGYVATIAMGVLLFVSQGGDGWWTARGWSMLLTWQLPLVVWVATLIAAIVLAVLRRSVFRLCLIGVGVIAVSIVAGLIIAALPR